MTADVALAEIEWLDMRRMVEVVISEGNDALISTELLVDCTRDRLCCELSDHLDE
jgi:hypothetical protein